MGTREDLIDCAKDVYLTSGYAGFSMRKVAQGAGVSATAIYHHFEDKNDLLFAVTLGGFRLFASYLKRAERVPDPMQRLLTSSRCYYDFAVEHPAYYQIMFLASDELKGVGRIEPGAPPDEIRDTFTIHLDYVRACAFATDDVLGLAVAGWAYGHGLISLYLSNRLGMLNDRPFRAFYDQTIDQHYQSLPRTDR